MTSLPELQQALTAFILDRDRPAVGNHFTSPLLSFEDVLTLHRNTYRETLSEALAANFPAVVALIGPDGFEALALRFSIAWPPASPVLSEYGAAFPDFLASQAILGDIPYIGDVARLEWAWNQAFHAPDAMALTPQALGQALENGETVDLHFHPSARLLASSPPVLAIWRWARRSDPNSAPPTAAAGGEHLLVLRPADEVLVRALDVGAFALLTALQAGRPLETALTAAAQVSPDFSPEGSLGALVAMGTFTVPTIYTRGSKP